jgi:hypothetical protein
MHVPGLKKKLVSVAMLEDRGYDIVFSSGKAYLLEDRGYDIVFSSGKAYL